MPVCALTIAASDPSGGAGIEMDLKVFAAHKVFGMTAITALTVQSSKGLKETYPVDASVFEKILDGLSDDMPVSAVKIGAVASGETVQAIAGFLDRMPGVPVVLDPVMVASSGIALARQGAGLAVADLLLSRTTVVTPNLAEASALSGITVKDLPDMRAAAQALCRMGARGVLLKGGHLQGDAVDVFYWEGKFQEFSSPRIPGEFHGTGCALSAGIAARLALGEGPETAVRKAREYLQGLMKSAFSGAGSAKILFPEAYE